MIVMPEVFPILHASKSWYKPTRLNIFFCDANAELISNSRAAALRIPGALPWIRRLLKFRNTVSSSVELQQDMDDSSDELALKQLRQSLK